VVDRDHALVLGQVNHHEAAAADAAAERVGHAQRGGRGDGRVDRIAALVEDGQRGFGGLFADGGDRAAAAGGDRVLASANGGARTMERISPRVRAVADLVMGADRRGHAGRQGRREQEGMQAGKGPRQRHRDIRLFALCQ
jgi:hypothetical protein